MLYGAGWHTSQSIAMPDKVMLVRLPSYAPELDPIERVWPYLRKRYLSYCLQDKYDAIRDAAAKPCAGRHQTDHGPFARSRVLDGSSNRVRSLKSFRKTGGRDGRRGVPDEDVELR